MFKNIILKNRICFFLLETITKRSVGFLLILFVAVQTNSAQGIIVLEKKAPSTATQVQATQQVVLKPGFHAVGKDASFDAKIGQTNSLFPTDMLIAEGSNVLTQNIFVPGKGQNYIKTTTYLTADQSRSLSSYQYLDGLGRATQTVNARVTHSGADLVSMVEYDGAGREYIKWLPAALLGNAGDYVDPATLKSNSISLHGSDTRPYVETLLEASPLNRVTGEKNAGADMGNHQKTVDYQTNDGTIAYFYANSNNQLVKGSNYVAASLYITKSMDEDNKASYEFKDLLGQVVLKRSINEDGNVDTYYVYNDLGQLCFVIPPEATPQLINNVIDQNTINQFCYLYQYDERGNCIYKKLPGCDPINMVYDQADRLVLSQDGNQSKAPKKWTVTKYDVFGRVLYTGIINHDLTTEKIAVHNGIKTESYVGASGFKSTGYSWSGFTLLDVDFTPLTVNYYDNYSFIPQGDKLLYDSGNEQNGYPAQWNNATGLLTGTRTYLLDGSGSNTTAMYYDDHARIVQTRSTNHLGGYDIAYNAYNFTGQLTTTLKEHRTSKTLSTPLTELYTLTYDNDPTRPLTTTYSINKATPVTLASNSYDDLGRLTTKLRHNKDTETFTYNIRNWTTKITSGTFEENLFYNSVPQGILNTPCFNGNIALSTWSYKGGTNKYGYAYDNLNRLTATTYYDSNNQPNGWYTEQFVYDKMGNITHLGRMGASGPIDDLTLNYNGNQLKNVNDFFGSQGLYSVKEYNNKANMDIEFTYDANGNMTKDLDRDIVTIQYNVLNLPDIIQFKNGNQIINKYDAGGQKLGTEYFTYKPSLQTPIVVQDGTIYQWKPNEFDQDGTAYIGNFEYKTLNGNAAQTTLSRIYNNEGYVEDITLPIPNYYYFRRDHLGNNREVWLANTNTTKQWTQYYASGLPWASNTGDNPGFQERKYNGKEFVEMHGYDTYDFNHRGFYPAGGFFSTIDWKAEDSPDVSPYSYANDNPVRYRDENGDDGWDVIGGFVNAVSDDATMGITDRSGNAKPNDEGDYNTGQTAGHYASILFGGLETLTGGGAAVGGVSLAVAGSETVVAIPAGAAVAVKGGAMMAHGTMMMKSAVDGLKNQSTKSDNNSDTKVNPKREAREAAKEKRGNQPASEKYTKDKAKAKGKAEGPDARRKAHDAKGKGEPDRSKKQIDEDYKIKK